MREIEEIDDFVIRDGEIQLFIVFFVNGLLLLFMLLDVKRVVGFVIEVYFRVLNRFD